MESLFFAHTVPTVKQEMATSKTMHGHTKNCCYLLHMHIVPETWFRASCVKTGFTAHACENVPDHARLSYTVLHGYCNLLILYLHDCITVF